MSSSVAMRARDRQELIKEKQTIEKEERKPERGATNEKLQKNPVKGWPSPPLDDPTICSFVADMIEYWVPEVGSDVRTHVFINGDLRK